MENQAKKNSLWSVEWKRLKWGNEKTLYNVESSSSAERAFVTMEKFVRAEAFSMFHSLGLTKSLDTAE